MVSLEQLQEDLRRTEKQARELKAAIDKAQMDERTERQMKFRPVAELAHNMFCEWNHTDGCAWGYEESGGCDAWSGLAHRRWLDKIEELCGNKWRKVTIEEVQLALETFQKAKKEQPNLLYIIKQLK